MIEEKYIKGWNLRDFGKKFEDIKISEPAIDRLTDFLYNFPKIDYKIGMFIGNLIDGNSLYNHLISQLIRSRKIKHQCLRWGLDTLLDKYEYNHSDYLDMLLIDQLEFKLLSDLQKLNLINKLDNLYNRTDFIFLNIPREEELESAPNTLIDLISQSPYNIKINNYDI